MGAFIDLTGRRVGRLVVLAKSSIRRRAHVSWDCMCDCGTAVTISGPELRGGDAKSCGCLARDVVRARNTTHGMSRHPAYQAWCSMHARCAPDGPFADRYAERGISVTERWATFETFWEDMGPTWKAGLTVERVDNDGPYSPANCIWADLITQANNKRDSRWLETPKGRMTVAVAAREFGVKYSTIIARLNRGLSGSQALDLAA